MKSYRNDPANNGPNRTPSGLPGLEILVPHLRKIDTLDEFEYIPNRPIYWMDMISNTHLAFHQVLSIDTLKIIESLTT